MKNHEKNLPQIDMNNSWLRKLISDEMRESLLFCGLVDNYHCKTKVVEKNKTYYVIDSSIGKVEIYSSKHIKINGERFNSINQARESLARYL